MRSTRITRWLAAVSSEDYSSMATIRPPVPDAPALEDLQRCVHCGYCLNDCPTYVQLGSEAESPRGRLHLIDAMVRGRVSPTPELLAHLNRCILCRACETACPSAVPFGRIMERGRAMALGQGARDFRWRLRTSLGDLLLPHPRRLRLAAGALRFYQRSGLQRVARGTRILNALPGSLRDVEQFLPPLPDVVPVPAAVQSPAAAQHRVGMLLGCVTPVMYPNLNDATVRVLLRNGCEVLTSTDQPAAALCTFTPAISRRLDAWPVGTSTPSLR